MKSTALVFTKTLTCIAISLAFATSAFSQDPPPATLLGVTSNNLDMDSSQGVESYLGRSSGVYYGDRYYLFFNESDGDDPFKVKYGPAVYYGGTALDLDDGLNFLTYDNPVKLALPGYPVAADDDYNQYFIASGILNNNPYLFFVNTNTDHDVDAGGNTLFRYTRMSVPSNEGAPTFSAYNDIPTANYDSRDEIFDLAIAPIGDELQLFVSNESNVLTVIDVTENEESELDFSTSSLTLDTFNAQLESVDACNASLSDSSGLLPTEVIAIAAIGYDFSGNLELAVYLWQPGITTTEEMPQVVFNLPVWGNTYTIPRVRIAYGPAAGTSPVNSLTVFYQITQNPSTPLTYSAQIALPETFDINQPPELLSYGSDSGTEYFWQELGTGWTPTAGTSWTVFNATAPISGEENYQQLSQNLTYASFGGKSFGNAITSSVTMQLVPVNTSTMTVNTNEYSSLSVAEQFELTESWSLLGVVTGIPPFVLEQTGSTVTPIFEISYSTEDSESNTVSNETSVGMSVGTSGKVIKASAGFANTTIDATTTGENFSLSFSIGNVADADGSYNYLSNQGLLIVSMPQIEQGLYSVKAYDGSDLGFDTLAQWFSGTDIVSFPFQLNNPNAEISNSIAPLRTFPVSDGDNTIAAWPLLDNVEAWQNQPTTATTGLGTLLYTGAQTIAASINTASTETLSSADLVTYTSSITNKINGTLGLASLFNFTGSISTTSTQTSMEQSATTFSWNYPKLPDNSLYTSFQIQPVIYNRDLSVDQPSWMPTIFGSSDPWLLTWDIIDIMKKTGDGVNHYLGSFVADQPLEADGWRYYNDFKQWAFYLSGSPQWNFLDDFNSWVFASAESTPDNAFLYISDDTWLYSNALLYPWYYDYSDDTWKYAE